MKNGNQLKSWLSKLLREKSSLGTAQQVRVGTARFRHLLQQYGRIITLDADAAEKQSGEFILDKAYLWALTDRACETAEAMTYDLNVLTTGQYMEFYDAVKGFQEKAAALIRAGAAVPFSASEKTEEPEYLLLRELRKILFQSGRSVSSNGQLPVTTLFDAVESMQETAADSLAGLVQSLEVSAGGSLPVKTAVMDLMGFLAGSDKPLWIPDPLSADSTATREFLTAFFALQSRGDGSCGPTDLDSARMVAVAQEDSTSAAVFCREGYGLLDAYLGCAPYSNYVYCRFPSRAKAPIAAGILARLGFSVSRTIHGVTGWAAAEPAVETTAKLRAVGEMAAFLLQPSPAGIQPGRAEDDVNRFFRIHG